MSSLCPARCKAEQNIEVLRTPDEMIHLRSTREIGAREELRAWLSPALVKESGIYKVCDEDKEGRNIRLWISKRLRANVAHKFLLSVKKALAKRTRMSTSTRVSFSHQLALSLVELKFIRKSTQVFPRLAIQRKSTQVDHKSTVYKMK